MVKNSQKQRVFLAVPVTGTGQESIAAGNFPVADDVTDELSNSHEPDRLEADPPVCC
jgi:hypothetical protein